MPLHHISSYKSSYKASYYFHNILSHSIPRMAGTSAPAAVHRRGFQCPAAGVLDDVDAAHQLCLVVFFGPTKDDFPQKMAGATPRNPPEMVGFATRILRLDWFFRRKNSVASLFRCHQTGHGGFWENRWDSIALPWLPEGNRNWDWTGLMYTCLMLILKEIARHLLDYLVLRQESFLWLSSAQFIQ